MWNARLDEAQAGIKIAGRNIKNLRYADDTTLMARSKEELKSFLIKVKEKSEKAGLKLIIQKTRIMASSPITSWQLYRETGNNGWLYFGGIQNHCRWWLQLSWSPRKLSLSLFPLFPHLFAMKWWDQMPWSSFSECWIFSQLFHSLISLLSRSSLVPLHFLP